MTRRFEAAIFDFGGVFTNSPLENFARFEQARGLPPRFLGGVIKANPETGAFARYERGEIGAARFDELFAAETRAAGFEVRGRELVALLSLALRPEMVEALARVKRAGLKTGCITNNLPDVGTDTLLGDDPRRAEARRVFALFDHVIESSKAGVRKPEPAIYEMMCAALGVEPERCVFLDDLGVNLKPARAMGMATIKVAVEDAGPAIAELGALVGLDLRG